MRNVSANSNPPSTQKERIRKCVNLNCNNVYICFVYDVNRDVCK
jgi:hypothetical protein